jgi:pimeloyl-ACP methyl ester carboxylesterase
MGFIGLLLLLLGGCASYGSAGQGYEHIAPGKLPVSDLSLQIPGLTSCTGDPNHTLHLKAGEPVYVLVHGCFGSSGQFRGLAQVFAFNGQQTVCFTYDDRARLASSAAALRRAINLLTVQTRSSEITVIGHSQGALIAYNSLTYSPPEPTARPLDLRLVTISGPFGGIAAAQTCGRRWLYPLTLGLLPLSCYAVTGSKWLDITNSSRFIRQPGALSPQVSRFLKIDTDERGSCRRRTRGRCAESDAVFSLAEQRNSMIEGDARTRRLQVDAGHVEIVGDERVSPAKLIAILQQQGAILPTAPERLAAFDRLIARVYGTGGGSTRTP